jgi:GNAT superfamily N-acetyltransferase
LTSREIATLMARLGAESLRAHMIGDPVLTKRYGFVVARRGGLWCYSSTKFGAGVFNHVSGYGTFAPATQASIDAVLRYYDGLGEPANVEVMLPVVTPSARALLKRNGFRPEGILFQCHVRTTARPPRAHEVRGLEITRAQSRDASRYAKLATRGFGGGGQISEVFERGWTRQIRSGRRMAAFIGRVNGRDAGTGVILLRPKIAGLYSGSVMRRYRGRGIQNAMIAARLAHGWARGVRTFYSWTDPDSSSADNLRDEGFRTRFEVHWYTRALSSVRGVRAAAEIPG